MTTEAAPDLDLSEHTPVAEQPRSMDVASARIYAVVERVLLAQGRHLFCWLPVGFGLGALCFFALRFEPSPLMVALAVGGAGVVGGICLWLGWQVLIARVVGFAILAVAAGFGDLACQANVMPPMPALPTHAVIVTGRVLSFATLPPRTDEDDVSHRLTLGEAVFDTPVDTGMSPLRRVLRMTLREGDATHPAPGDLIQVRAMLRPPAPPSLPQGRDPQREAWFSGLAGSGYALGDARIIGSAVAPRRVERVREAIADKVSAALPDQTGAIAATLLAGETGGLDAQTRAAFSASGLSHLLAVAGLHLGLVMAAVMVVVRTGLTSVEYVALRWPCRQISALTGLGVGAGYVLLTGAHLPSLRALGMASLLTLALLTGRRVLSMRSLSLVALAVLLVAPVSVVDVSFQMSFAAVMGLIAGYEVLRTPLERLRDEGQWSRRFLSHAIALVLTSLFAGLATLPVSMAHFGAVEPWFVVANFVAVPLAAVWIMPFGLLALLAMPFHAESLPLHLMGGGIHLVQLLAAAVSTFPMAHDVVPLMPAPGLLCVFLGLCVLCVWKGAGRLFGLVPMIIGIASVWLVAKPALLVSADAGLIGVRTPATLLLGQHSSLERRTLADWQAALAQPLGPLPDICARGVCRMSFGTRIVLLRTHDTSDGWISPTAEECQGIALFVSASPARNACPGVPFIDRFSVWRDGAYSVYAEDGGFRLVSDRSARRSRLWVPPPGWHGMPNLPMAKAE